MTYKPFRVLAPAVLPISQDEAKAHCRVDGTAEDAYIDGLIAAAVAYLDGYTGILGQCLMQQDWAQQFDAWQDFPLCLGPVTEIVSIDYFDSDGVAQQVDLSTVTLQHRILSSVAKLKVGASWPAADFDHGPVTVTWRAGMALPVDVDEAIKHAMKLMIGHWFENREAVVIGTITSELPMAVDALLAPHRKVMP